MHFYNTEKGTAEEKRKIFAIVYFMLLFVCDYITVHNDKRKLNLPYSGISTAKVAFSPGLIVTALTENS